MAESRRRDGHRPNYAVPALEKALDILEYLSAQEVPRTQAQLARALDRQPSELFRMLTALEARGYLRRDGQSGGYALTLKLFELSRTHSPFEELLRTATPLMRELSDEIRETCHLSVLHRGKVLVLAQEESPKPIRMSVEPGSLHSPLLTVSGRILLAAMADEQRDAFLAEETDFARLPKARRIAFLQRVQAARDNGHDIAEGETFVGGLDVGVLVGTPRSTVRAALIIATLKHAHGPDLKAMLPTLRRFAGSITERAGLARNKEEG